MNRLCVRTKAPAEVEVHGEDVREDKIIQRLIARHAEGNVSLHRGLYLTQADVDEIVSRALSHDFSVYTGPKKVTITRTKTVCDCGCRWFEFLTIDQYPELQVMACMHCDGEYLVSLKDIEGEIPT